MKCPRCFNQDPAYFYQGSNGIYCRKCVGFKRVLLDEDLDTIDYEIDQDNCDYTFSYELTKYQKQASSQCLEAIKKNDVLLLAVCGAGKTEIVVESIADYLKRGLKVCYAISRKEVVKELSVRFSEIFSKADVIGVYGGHHDKLAADLIVCTTHQLFRYFQTFDLLILDEVDAFPLSGNDALMNISLNACKGHIIFSTATVNTFLNNYLKRRHYVEVNLFVRPSLKPLIEPEVYKENIVVQLIHLYRLLRNMQQQCIIFLSKREEVRMYYLFFKHFIDCTYVYSNLPERDQNIKAFKDKKYQFIFATTVLERGITIKDVNIIIIYNHEGIFDESSLIQMTGRVGRNVKNPYGEAYILTSIDSEEINKCISNIERANKMYELSLLS